MNRSYVYVPIGLCKNAISENYIQYLKLYVALKITSGKSLAGNQEVYDALNEIDGFSKRTIRRNLKKLIERDWIGYNKNDNIYHIRSFETVRKIEQAYSTSAAYCHKDYLNDFRAFCAGSLICSTIRRRRTEIYRENLKRGVRSKAKTSDPMPFSYKYLSHLINKPYTTCQSLRASANKAGFISYKRRRKLTDIHVEHLKLLQFQYPEKYKRYYAKEGKVYIEKTALVYPCLHIKSRRKITSYDDGYFTEKKYERKFFSEEDGVIKFNNDL